MTALGAPPHLPWPCFASLGLHRGPTSSGEGRQPDGSSVGRSGCEDRALAGPQAWPGRQTGAPEKFNSVTGPLAEVSQVRVFPDFFLPHTPTSRVKSITAQNKNKRANNLKGSLSLPLAHCASSESGARAHIVETTGGTGKTVLMSLGRWREGWCLDASGLP